MSSQLDGHCKEQALVLRADYYSTRGEAKDLQHERPKHQLCQIAYAFFGIIVNLIRAVSSAFVFH